MSMINAKDYLESQSISIKMPAALGKGGSFVLLVNAYKAIDMSKKEFADGILRMIENYKKQNVKGDISDYINSYCKGYSEGMLEFV